MRSSIAGALWGRPMARKGEPTTSLDVSIARRAVGLTPGMSGGAYCVAFALLEHFNRKTGQCDPSIARLATMLGLGEATVKRATKELCDRQLFQKSSHGGLSHRAKYEPNWSAMKTHLKSWEERMPSGEAPVDDEANGSELIPSTDQDRSLEQLNIDPRTLLKKPYGRNPVSDGACGNADAKQAQEAEKPPASRPEERLKGLWRGNEQKAQSLPSKVVQGRNAEIAEQAAIKRWNKAMSDRGRAAYVRFVEWVTPEISSMATQAELQRKGDGERFLVQQMRAAGLAVNDY